MSLIFFVGIPTGSTHISWDILKFLQMLENHSHLLDCKFVALLAVKSKKIKHGQFDNYVAGQCQISDLEKSASVYQEQIDLVYDIVSEIIRSPENEKQIRTVYEERISYLHNKIQEKVILTECEN